MAEVSEVKTSDEIPALGLEVGVDTQLAFATPFRPVLAGTQKSPDEELQEILRDDWTEDSGPTVRQLATMRRMDGHARALYRLLTLPIRAALKNATFIPADDDQGEAEFIDQVFNLPPEGGGMSVTFQRVMSQMLTALFDGFAAFEKVFWIPTHGPLEGKVTLRKLAYRPSDTIYFLTDKEGGFAGFRQRASYAGRVVDAYIERERAFYIAAQEEERKFYGVSYFQSAFPHYDAKIKLMFTAHLAAQRAAVGTRVGTIPPNASLGAKAEFKNSLANLSLAQYMMMPEGFKVELLKEGGSYDFLGLINHHNHMMSESVLANFFDQNSGAGDNDGSLVNFAKPGDDMFVLMLRTIMDELASHINHYVIPQLVDFNFDGGRYPTFAWGALTDEQREAIASTFDKLANPTIVTPEFMRELEKHQAEEFGFEIDYDMIAMRDEEQRQMEQMAAMGVQPALPGEIPPEAEEEVESLDDVVALLVQRAEADAGVMEGTPAPQGAAQGGAQAQPPQPAAQQQGGAAAAPAAQNPRQPRTPRQQPTVGLTPDMLDWADRMVALSGEDFRDG